MAPAGILSLTAIVLLALAATSVRRVRRQVGFRICDPTAAVIGAAQLMPGTWEALRSALAAELPGVSPVGAEEFERRLDVARASADRRTQGWGMEVFSLEVGEPIESESTAGPQIPPATNFE